MAPEIVDVRDVHVDVGLLAVYKVPEAPVATHKLLPQPI